MFTLCASSDNLSGTIPPRTFRTLLCHFQASLKTGVLALNPSPMPGCPASCRQTSCQQVSHQLLLFCSSHLGRHASVSFGTCNDCLPGLKPSITLAHRNSGSRASGPDFHSLCYRFLHSPDHVLIYRCLFSSPSIS